MPTNRPIDLPEYENPPLTEVVLSFQFGALAKLKSWHVGHLWDRLKSKYENIQELAPLQSVFETFNTPIAANPAIQFQSFSSMPLARFWFSSGDQLLQIQQDRIVHNWRKHEGDGTYPRYGKVKERFEDDVKIFCAFLKDNDLGEIQLNQCEVTYVNIIQPKNLRNAHRSFTTITNLLSDVELDVAGQTFENINMDARWVLKEKEMPIGRVHAKIIPINMAADASEAMNLEITARCRPADPSIETGFKLLDQASSAVVRTFALVTSKQMESEWNRKR